MADPRDPRPEDETIIQEDAWEEPVAEQVVVEEEVVQPPRRRLPTLWPWLLGVLLVGLGAVALAFALMREDDEPAETTPAVALVDVPLVEGLKEDIARDRLAEAGLAVKDKTAPSTEQRGVVTAQEPGAGERVAKGSVVLMTISGGPPQLAVPNVVGGTTEVAQKTLTDAGFETRVVEAFAERPKGIVAKQEPAGNAKARKGALVTLTVSKGGRPGPVPDVVGLPGSQAVQVLQDAGFDARVATVPGGKSGTVVAQDPAGGETAAPGSPVRLNVAAGEEQGTTTTATTEPTTTAPKPPPAPATTTVPDVVGQELADAGDTFARAGLRAYVRYVVSEEKKGTVIQQAQPAGTKVKRDSSVGVNVSSGKAEGQSQPVAVPDVTGLKQDEALQRLTSAGFETRSYEIASDPTKLGVVLEHQPKGQAPKGALVLLYVGA